MPSFILHDSTEARLYVSFTYHSLAMRKRSILTILSDMQASNRLNHLKSGANKFYIIIVKKGKFTVMKHQTN